jgi:uncharacterized repeat protein (TIGR03806 family)
MRLLLFGLATCVIVGCGIPDYLGDPPNRLSSYDLFDGDGASQEPENGVVPYAVNSQLFSDYALKRRFIKLPGGESAAYGPTETFEMPIGTIIAKTFSYPKDARDPSQGERLLETRLLIHGKEGWGGLTYIWNFKQTEAFLEVAGHDVVATWIDKKGDVQINEYQIPNTNQCKQCHTLNDRIVPIGIRARHLNREFEYPEGTENQLTHWSRIGVLRGAPNHNESPKLADYDDPETGSLDDRARAWLEINCAHCHTQGARAWNTGLDLMASQTDESLLGIYKTPSAAGRGTGGFRYDIVPGKPEESILLHRILSEEPDVAMPEIGRTIVHREGAELVRHWIANMEDGENEN